MEISFVRQQSHCEHCGTPITNCYIVKDEVTGFKIRVGSTCINHFTKLNKTSIDYIVKELKAAEKYLVLKRKIEKALESGDEEKLNKALFGIYWQEIHSDIRKGAQHWIEYSQHRYNKRVEDLNGRLKKNTVINQENPEYQEAQTTTK